MKKFEGTPKPWTAKANEHFYEVNANLFNEELYETASMTASIHFHRIRKEGAVSDSLCKENEANAKLIAAAPDLLEALQKVVECTDKGQFAEAVEVSIKAINKALD